MTEHAKETNTAGSPGIPQRRRKGVAGTSREVPKCEQMRNKKCRLRAGMREGGVKPVPAGGAV